MSDKYNESSDDFFAKFDEIAENESEKISETDTYSADAADAEYSYGSASSYRSGKKTTDGEKQAPKVTRKRVKKTKSKKKKSKKGSTTAKAKKELSSAKAKAIAAS